MPLPSTHYRYHHKKGSFELIKLFFFLLSSDDHLQACELILKITPKKSIPRVSAPNGKTAFPSWKSHTPYTLWSSQLHQFVDGLNAL